MSKDLPVVTPLRLCWECKHFYYMQADGGYSEYTPGSDWSISCNRNVWDFDPYNATEDDFRRILTTATTCQKFEPRSK